MSPEKPMDERICANCGEPYGADEDGGDATVCSPECAQSYLDYLQG